MTITTTRGEPIPDFLNRHSSRTHRLPPRAEILILAALVAVSLCGLPLVVGEARAGGGGGGGGCSGISYVYDCAGRLTCVYDACTGQGVGYAYDNDGNITSVSTATSCSQNTCSIMTDKTFALSWRVPALNGRTAHGDSAAAHVASAVGEKPNNSRATAHSKQLSEEKPLIVSLR